MQKVRCHSILLNSNCL